jgi:hypothetical protein
VHSKGGALRATLRRVVPAGDGSGRYTLAPPPPESNKLAHCSALIRLTANRSELFVGHATWAGAETMTRAWKIYDMPLRLLPNEDGPDAARVPNVVRSFSGFPGQLASEDDFYVLANGLVATETTIGFNNASLAALIQPQSVLEWLRNVVANRLAESAPSWAQLFSRYNSGTYNNEVRGGGGSSSGRQGLHPRVRGCGASATAAGRRAGGRGAARAYAPTCPCAHPHPPSRPVRPVALSALPPSRPSAHPPRRRSG